MYWIKSLHGVFFIEYGSHNCDHSANNMYSYMYDVLTGVWWCSRYYEYLDHMCMAMAKSVYWYGPNMVGPYKFTTLLVNNGPDNTSIKTISGFFSRKVLSCFAGTDNSFSEQKIAQVTIWIL